MDFLNFLSLFEAPTKLVAPINNNEYSLATVAGNPNAFIKNGTEIILAPAPPILIVVPNKVAVKYSTKCI